MERKEACRLAQDLVIELITKIEHDVQANAAQTVAAHVLKRSLEEYEDQEPQSHPHERPGAVLERGHLGNPAL